MKCKALLVRLGARINPAYNDKALVIEVKFLYSVIKDSLFELGHRSKCKNMQHPD